MLLCAAAWRGDASLGRLRLPAARPGAAPLRAPPHPSTPQPLNPVPAPPRADPAQRITVKEILEEPWVNKDLPPGVKQMNDNMRMPPSGSQSEEEIRAVVTEARATPANPAGWVDDYIDDTMDAEQYESSYDGEWGTG